MRNKIVDLLKKKKKTRKENQNFILNLDR
jgi:hypothetical protein